MVVFFLFWDYIFPSYFLSSASVVSNKMKLLLNAYIRWHRLRAYRENGSSLKSTQTDQITDLTRQRAPFPEFPSGIRTMLEVLISDMSSTKI